jgi:glucose-1-phosphate adenylyltransferase
MLSDGCVISSGAYVERSVLSPGVQVHSGALIRESVVLTDAVIEAGAIVERTIVDKRSRIGENARVGAIQAGLQPVITMLGKNSRITPGLRVEPGAVIGTDVIPSDLPERLVRGDEYVETRRFPYEV